MSQQSAQALKYQTPHQNIYELANAELAPALKVDVKGDYAILQHRNIYKSIEELSVEELKLAGIRTNPANNISSREGYFYKLTILDINKNEEFNINGLPETGKFCKLSWSYEYEYVSVVNIFPDKLELWCIDVRNATANRLIEEKLNGNLGNPVVWLKDNTMLVHMVPENALPLKSKSTEIPTGPLIAENTGQTVENRTFQDLLKDEVDEYNFEVIATSEIIHLTLDGKSKLWKSAAMHDGCSISPDGKFIILSEIKKPFSHFVTCDRFAYSSYIYDIDGKLFKTLVEAAVIEYLPQGFMAVQKGMRQLKWRSDKPNTIVWVEALDEGNPEVFVPFRDVVYESTFPFEVTRELIKTKDRFSAIFFTNTNTALVYDRWWSNRNQRMILFDTTNTEEQCIFNERNFQDVYSDPGNFITTKNEYSFNVIQVDEDGSMYLTGDGYSAEGKSPFIDKYNLHTNMKERLYTAILEGKEEDIVIVLDAKKGDIITLIQSKSEYPNFYKKNIYTGEQKIIREYENPFNAIANIHKEVISYEREDGVNLNATLYLPVGYDKNTNEKLPMIMWAYPTEYKDKNTAGQKTAQDNSFIYPFWGSPLYWVNRGYIVLEGASFPILGEGDNQPNDSFTEQLISNAKAAIDAVDTMGFLDRSRVAIGGHSYGAFMVSMLLTHTNLFAAGIARSGAYNRTLTPFGFQSEERNYWQAKEVYDNMNPFVNADKMKTPLLLIHGQADNNSGTYTMQTERYYAALKALGANVRMVLLPHESHSYAAKESIMHVLWEQDQWLEKWLTKK